MKYKNPIILGDYSDPDVIRYKDNFYLIASSFNHTPIIPILKSKNLVDWKLIRYVDDKLPFERFKDVCHGDGVWAPSIRYHNGYFYIAVPFPDEGIYIYRTDDIENGKFEYWPLIEGKGFEDPCPIWVGNKCYLVLAFAKSRAGFNSCLGLYEVTPDLKSVISDGYKIIFDGHDTQPTIEGPKFYYRNDMFYILAPAGSVKTGWQTALRSKNIYGPYEQKIVMAQNDSNVNGPHQGALVDLKDGRDVFFHFQDLGPYGRIVHLQPVLWHNNWPIIGNVNDPLLTGTPVDEHEYFIEIKSNYKLDSKDNFDNKLSLMWQTPANKTKDFYSFSDGLVYKCLYYNEKGKKALNQYPGLLEAKIRYYSFKAETKIVPNFLSNGDEAGLFIMGKEYAYISIIKRNDKNHIILASGKFDNEEDIVLEDIEYDNSNEIIFNIKYKYPNEYQLGYNNKYFKNKFKALPGRWIGAKYGIFARGLSDDGGYATFKYFKVLEVKK